MTLIEKNISMSSFVLNVTVEAFKGTSAIVLNNPKDYDFFDNVNVPLYFVRNKYSRIREHAVNIIPFNLIEFFSIDNIFTDTEDVTTEQFDIIKQHAKELFFYRCQEGEKYITLNSNTSTTLLMDQYEYNGESLYIDSKQTWVLNEEGVSQYYKIYYVIDSFLDIYFLDKDDANVSVTMTDLKTGKNNQRLHYIIGHTLYKKENRLIGDNKNIYFDEPVELRYQTSEQHPSSDEYYFLNKFGETYSHYIVGIRLVNIEKSNNLRPMYGYNIPHIFDTYANYSLCCKYGPIIGCNDLTTQSSILFKLDITENVSIKVSEYDLEKCIFLFETMDLQSFIDVIKNKDSNFQKICYEDLLEIYEQFIILRKEYIYQCNLDETVRRFISSMSNILFIATREKVGLMVIREKK